MAYAVELYLELNIEAQVYDIWQSLKAARISSFMVDGHFRPHISLGVCENIDKETYRPHLESFADQLSPFNVWLPNIGVFMGEKAVIYIGVTATQELLDLHARFYRAFGACALSQSQHYHVGQWVPHITLAMNVETKDLARAMNVVSAPVKTLLNRFVEVQQVGLVDTVTGETFFYFPLTDQQNGDN